MGLRPVLLLCVLLCSFGIALSQAPRYTLSGVVLQLADSTPVPYAHLYMSDRRDFAISSPEGTFSITYTAKDTLQVSSIGHISRWIVLDAPLADATRQDTIWMRTRIYQLSSVQVYAKNPLEGFSSNRRINYGYRNRSIPSVLNANPTLRAGAPTDIVGLSIVLEGVVTALFAPLTSEYKQLKRLRELVQEKRLNKYYKQLKETKLSDAFVLQHTHLRPEEIDDFIDFWNPSMVELDIAAEYDLIDILNKQEKRYITYLEQINSHRAFSNRISTLELRQWLDLQMSLPFTK